MVNATEDITIFNRRYDSTTRRQRFIPTVISGVSVYHVSGMSPSGLQGPDNRAETAACKIRIPISAEIGQSRQYISETGYKALSDDEASGYWTIQKGCYVILGQYEPDDDSSEITADELDKLESSGSYEVITVIEYADNAGRGSDSVKHWRIGGA